MKIWSNLYDSMGTNNFDSQVEQRVNQKLFEGYLITYFEVPSHAANAMAPSSLQSQELDEEEEQIVRYASGFVPMSLLK